MLICAVQASHVCTAVVHSGLIALPVAYTSVRVARHGFVIRRCLKHALSHGLHCNAVKRHGLLCVCCLTLRAADLPAISVSVVVLMAAWRLPEYGIFWLRYDAHLSYKWLFGDDQGIPKPYTLNLWLSFDAHLSYHPWWSMYCLKSSTGGCAP